MRDQLNKGNHFSTPLKQKRTFFQGGETKNMKMRKFMASFLAFAMLLSLVAIPVGTADAATTYSALAVTSVEKNKVNQTLGAIKFVLDNFYTESQGLVKIPNFEISNINVIADNIATNKLAITAKDAAWVTTSAAVDAVADSSLGKGEFKVVAPSNLTFAAGDKDLEFAIVVTGKPTGDGEVTANIQGLQGQFAAGSVVVATTGEGAVTIALDGTPGAIAGSEKAVKFIITENIAGALYGTDGVNRISLKLPSGYTWKGTAGGAAAPVTVSALIGNAADIDNAADVVLSSDKRTLTITGMAQSSVRSIYRVEATVVASANANFGDVVVTVGGNAKLDASEITVAKYQDFGIKVTAEEKEVVAGLKSKVGKLTIAENTAGSFIQDRTIYLKLPAGLKWAGLTQSITSGGANIATHGNDASDTSGRTYKIVLGAANTSAKKIEIKEPQILASLGFAGDITVDITGNAGVTGSYKLGTVAAPLTITAEKTDMVVGVQNQAAGKIVAKEVKAGALENNGQIILNFIGGSVASFEGKPVVTVTEGDLDIEVDSYNANQIVLEVKSDSLRASTFEITGLKYTLSRSVPEGDFTIAITDGYTVGNAVLADSDVRAAFLAADDFDIIAKVSNATVVTPASGVGTPVVVESKFVIDAKTYKVGDVEKVMDVAPFIQDGRTMLPVRFVAEALGVSEDNIIWNAVTKQVTIMKGDRIAQLTIGSDKMLVNGVTVTMDTKAAVKDGRTVLPVRFVAQALGANIAWDEATRTVTVN